MERRCSGSCRVASSVDPTRSANSTVTGFALVGGGSHAWRYASIVVRPSPCGTHAKGVPPTRHGLSRDGNAHVGRQAARDPRPVLARRRTRRGDEHAARVHRRPAPGARAGGVDRGRAGHRQVEAQDRDPRDPARGRALARGALPVVHAEHELRAADRGAPQRARRRRRRCPAVARTKLRAALRGLIGAQTEQHQTGLAHLLGVDLGASGTRSVDPRALQASIIVAMRAVLEGLTQRGPVVLAVEDIH